GRAGRPVLARLHPLRAVHGTSAFRRPKPDAGAAPAPRGRAAAALAARGAGAGRARGADSTAAPEAAAAAPRLRGRRGDGPRPRAWRTRRGARRCGSGPAAAGLLVSAALRGPRETR